MCWPQSTIYKGHLMSYLPRWIDDLRFLSEKRDLLKIELQQITQLNLLHKFVILFVVKFVFH